MIRQIMAFSAVSVFSKPRGKDKGRIFVRQLPEHPDRILRGQAGLVCDQVALFQARILLQQEAHQMNLRVPHIRMHGIEI